MDENERNPFGFLSGLGDAAQPMAQYQSPDLAARAPAFGGYGYQAPSMNMVMAPNQMPRMNMNPEAINDPSVAAAMQILNQPMMIGQMPNMMGSGTGYQEQYGLLPSIAAAPMQRAMPQTPSQSLLDMMGMVAGGGNDYEFQGGMPNRAGVPVENRMGMSPDRGPIDAGSYDYSGLNDAFGPGHSDYGDVGYDN
jgi:hypothetical protein